MIIALKKSVGRIMVSNVQIQIDLTILSQKNLKVTEDLEKLLSLDVTEPSFAYRYDLDLSQSFYLYIF